MAQFFYKAKVDPTTIKEGFIEAENTAQAINTLERQGLFPLVVEKKEAAGGFSFSLGFRRIGLGAICVFTRQLANLIEAGLTLLSGLNILEKQIHNKYLKLVVNGLIDDLKDGKAFSQSLLKYPKVFSSLYVAILRSAEASGSLDNALNRLADFMEQQQDLKARIRMSLAYPLFILFVGVATVVFLVNFVIPKLMVIFTEFSQALPFPTQVLVFTTNFLAKYGWLILFSIIILMVIFLRLRKNPEIRLALDRLKLNLPLFKNFELKTQIQSFSRSMSILIGNGVSLINSLEISEDIVSNYYLRSKIRQIKEEVKEGASLTKILRETDFMPSFVISIVNVGEETGTLERSLERVSNTYQQELEKLLKVFVDLLGPVMILVVGLIIGFIVVAMLLPIFQLNIAVG